MSENNISIQEENQSEHITEKEARTIKDMLRRNLQAYKQKDASVSDQEWLEQLFKRELPEQSDEDSKKDAETAVKAIKVFDSKHKSVNEAYERGTSKEQWLEQELNDSVSGLSMAEARKNLQEIDECLDQANMRMSDALHRQSDGNINMNPNLDGVIAEHVVAETASLDAQLSGESIKVDVLQSNGRNSVDVRATNLNTGKYQNYQLKFGKTAKETIKYIEEGNYNNQRIIVPTEQLEEVQAYFRSKGSSKTITDCIEFDGVKGQSFSKSSVKKMQLEAQASNNAPELDYSNISNKTLVQNICKSVGRNALFSAAFSAGYNLVSKIFKGEQVEGDKLVGDAIKSGADTSVKVAAAGTLNVAVRRGILKCLAKNTPIGVITNIACVAIENAKILYRIATKKVSVSDGLEQMGRTTVSMVAGMSAMAKGAAVGAAIGAPLAAVLPVAPAITSFIGGTVGYIGGSKFGEAICSAGKAVANTAKNIVKTAVNTVKSVVSKATSFVKSLVSAKN